MFGVTEVLKVFRLLQTILFFERFCFLCVVCLFWWLYGFLWWVFAIEKLEYSRYNARIKYEWVATVLIVVICFLILMDLTKVLLSFVCLKFSRNYILLHLNYFDRKKKNYAHDLHLYLFELMKSNIWKLVPKW